MKISFRELDEAAFAAFMRAVDRGEVAERLESGESRIIGMGCSDDFPFAEVGGFGKQGELFPPENGKEKNL